MVLPLLSTDITVEINGITINLPLESTVLQVVTPPNFTTGFHWYTTGNTAGKPLVIPETFYGDFIGQNYVIYLLPWQR